MKLIIFLLDEYVRSGLNPVSQVFKYIDGVEMNLKPSLHNPSIENEKAPEVSNL